METSFPLQEKIISMSGKPFAIRAAAYLIDTVVFYILTFAVMYVESTAVGVVLYLFGREFPVVEGSSEPLNFIGGMLLMFFYFVIFEWLHAGEADPEAAGRRGAGYTLWAGRGFGPWADPLS